MKRLLIFILLITGFSLSADAKRRYNFWLEVKRALEARGHSENTYYVKRAQKYLDRAKRDMEI